MRLGRTSRKRPKASSTSSYSTRRVSPFIVLEAKAEDKSPLVGKEQARKYAKSQNCRFVILSNGNLHYCFDLDPTPTAYACGLPGEWRSSSKAYESGDRSPHSKLGPVGIRDRVRRQSGSEGQRPWRMCWPRLGRRPSSVLLCRANSRGPRVGIPPTIRDEIGASELWLPGWRRASSYSLHPLSSVR